MNRTCKAVAAALILATGIAGPAAAGPFEDGTAAFESRDYATAMRYWRPLADKGLARAQYGLGVMYANGDGVATDYGAALNWFRKAANQGNADAQVDLGVMYANGKGVTKDYAAALGWFRKAADQGNASAEFGIGVMYENGQGVVQDDATAVTWYVKAADKGNATAQYALGILYYKGQGVPKDLVSAYMWFDLAIAGSDKLQAPISSTDAQNYRNIVTAKMSASQIAEAQKRAREWKPSQETTKSSDEYIR
jgi:TPR repeat protein